MWACLLILGLSRNIMIGDYVYYKTLFILCCFLSFSLSIPVFGHISSVEQDLAPGEPAFFERQFWEGVEAFRAENYPEVLGPLGEVIAAWSLSPQDHAHLTTATNLYCLALIRTGGLNEALESYASFHEQGLLHEEGLYNYGVGALRSGDFQLAYQLFSQSAESITRPAFDFQYFAAISAFNLGKWQEAEAFFKKSLENAGFSAEKMVPSKKEFFQTYYLGLAQFRQGKVEEAYTTLEPLVQQQAWTRSQDDSFSPEGRQVLSIALHCALQLYSQRQSSVWWEKGCTLAQGLIDSAEAPSQRQEAVLLAARIYGDGGEYQQALELLAPYCQGQDELSLSCRFLSCELLASQGNLEAAIQEYGQLSEICSAFQLSHASQEILALGDKAAYRQGELLYSLGRYQEAAASFVSYRQKYPAGTYSDAALYFTGEALAKKGQIHRAILQHETLLKRHPASPYVFSSLVALMDLYKGTGEYGTALAVGSKLLAEFPLQTQAAGIPGKLAELRLLEQGMEPKQASLLAEFRLAGEHGSLEGRRLALELAHFYVNSAGGEDEGERLLLQLLEHLGAGEECIAAGASSLLGNLYRGQNRYREAALYFLQAAQLYLEMGSLQEEAAAALYRGAESFDIAGMAADSRAVALQLSTLFPQSSWAKAAQIFL